MTTRHRLLGLTVAVLWGVNFVAIHAGLEHFPPLFFAGLRFAVLALPVILFVPWPRVPVRWLLLYGLGFGTIQFAFLFLAMANGMPTGLASLVLQASAPFTAILGVVLLGERMSAVQVTGISLAVAGMALIAADRATHGASAAMVPVVVTLLGALGWAFGNIASRKAMEHNTDPHTPLRLTLWMSVVPPIPLFALSAFLEGPDAGWKALTSIGTHSGLIALAGLVYIVVLATIVGLGLWTYLMGRYPASRVAPFSLLVPIVGITTSWLALGERPTALELVGAAVVITGCLIGMTARPAARAPQHTDTPERGPRELSACAAPTGH
ncbi:EamA family transporter [Mycobacteroides abscessus]|uniref:EamA family transporter n=1 Tax=Mycobacteroides abscessus TaxID=36809 RepID=UPI000667C820|nr:EamA family transporter [Mycobacteroides abscessus]AKP56902.1 membrane protein [Mycobacteroides abscessus UC22]